MFYLHTVVKTEPSYQSFGGSLYGSVCLYNKSVFIAPEVHSVGANIPTNFVGPKICLFLITWKSIVRLCVQVQTFHFIMKDFV